MGKRRAQVIRRKMKRDDHQSLTKAKIPQEEDGNRLGLRKRIQLAKAKVAEQVKEAKRRYEEAARA